MEVAIVETFAGGKLFKIVITTCAEPAAFVQPVVWFVYEIEYVVVIAGDTVCEKIFVPDAMVVVPLASVAVHVVV